MEKEKKCNCDKNCDCGCQEGKECTCNDNCNCDENCDCGCHDGKKCDCNHEKNLKNKKEKKNNKEIDKLKEDNKNLNDKVLRLSAEIQNISKRHSEEISNMMKYEGIELIKNLLPIVDNFERSIEMDKSINEKYLEGYKMIYTNLLNVLNNIGVKEIECQDKVFDPNYMDAIMTEHVDGVEPNYVLVVLQKGYTYKDKVVRHAFVKVSK
ncbi:MAG: nucleotide exchange factor GrpE [Bacilli bacterium]|nr:nucleotide exchange factor GrpE [Bacilli bacterium]